MMLYPSQDFFERKNKPIADSNFLRYISPSTTDLEYGLAELPGKLGEGKAASRHPYRCAWVHFGLGASLRGPWKKQSEIRDIHGEIWDQRKMECRFGGCEAEIASTLSSSKPR
jgi:hypothetical protein